MKPTANSTQVGGDHYKSKQKYQHWDFVHDAKLGYMEGQITRYLSRDKTSLLEDARKAQHYAYKISEQVERKLCAQVAGLPDAAVRLFVDRRVTLRRPDPDACTAVVEFITRNKYEGKRALCIMYAATWRTREDLTKLRAELASFITLLEGEACGPAPNAQHTDDGK